MAVPWQGRVGDMMQVICTDGTVLQCQRFEAIDSGVLLFGESQSQSTETGEEADEEEAEEEQEANAFVPIHQLRFVLPEGIQPGVPGRQSVGQPMSQPSGMATTGAQAPPQGAMPPRQSGGQVPPQQQQSGPSQQGAGRSR